MLTRTIPMQWLIELVQEYRNITKRNLFYKKVNLATSPSDFEWIRQGTCKKIKYQLNRDNSNIPFG